MTATGRTRASRTDDEEDVLRRPAPEATPDESAAAPALPDVDGGRLEPDAWLALQQTIGNKAVGSLVERRRASQPLPPEARRDLEGAFGQDFGQVEVHSGAEVDQAAQALDAAAFTVGKDIYVHSALPDYDDPFGREVLSEEVAHVAQGAGREGAGRVTAPDESAEKKARAAGRAAAAGKHADVTTDDQLQGAVARFELGGVLSAAAGAIAAAAAGALEKTELSDEEKDRLSAGALFPLRALWAQLGDKLAAAKDGKPSAPQLQPLADNSEGIGKFIYSFAGPPAIQSSLEQAAVSATAGRNALVAAINPQRTLLQTADAMATTAADINGLASASAEAPAAPPAGATPAAPATADILTPAEAEQLRLGVADPLTKASEQLKSPEHDLDTIIDRLANIPGVLRSFSRPASLVPQLHRKAMAVEIQARTLVAVHEGAKAAVSEAMGLWQSAIITLEGLTVKSPGGGAKPSESGAASGGDDEEKKKAP